MPFQRRSALSKLVAGTVILGAVLVAPAMLFAWGDVGHRISGEAAALAMPPSTPAFFRNAAKQLGYLNPEPDRWRERTESNLDPALNNGSAPDHFIDMELASPAVLAQALKARDRYGFIDTLAAANIKASTMGVLPFSMLEWAQKLRVDFRNWRIAPDSIKPWIEARIIEARIIDDAGILGHYVADGANPAHTSVNFNGWTGPNPNGYATDNRFHARFESIYVGSNVKLSDVTSRMDTVAKVLPDLRAAIIQYLHEGNAQVEPMYKIDKAHPFDAMTTAPENKAFAVARLTAGATMLRDIWWTAWVTSAP
jgi:hypothetical protein